MTKCEFKEIQEIKRKGALFPWQKAKSNKMLVMVQLLHIILSDPNKRSGEVFPSSWIPRWIRINAKKGIEIYRFPKAIQDNSYDKTMNLLCSSQSSRHIG